MFHLSQQADIADSSYEPGLVFGVLVCGFVFWVFCLCFPLSVLFGLMVRNSLFTSLR